MYYINKNINSRLYQSNKCYIINAFMLLLLIYDNHYFALKIVVKK